MNAALRLALLLCGTALGACSGGAGDAPLDPDPGPQEESAADGRVFLENRTLFAVESAYLDSLGPGGIQVRRVALAAGASGDIGARLLPAEAEVEFDLAIEVEPGQARVRRKAWVQVDGPVRLVLLQLDAADVFSLTVVPADSG